MVEISSIGIAVASRKAKAVHIFINHVRTIVSLIHYEREFYTMYEKLPGNGRICKPVYDTKSGKYQISYSDLACLTNGLVRIETKLFDSV